MDMLFYSLIILIHGINAASRSRKDLMPHMWVTVLRALLDYPHCLILKTTIMN